MFKNKRWLAELYLYVEVGLHVSVFKGPGYI